jgi:UDP-glucuronate decarboxylase
MKPADGRVRFIQGDVRDGLPDEKFDEIYHLACPASPKHYQKDPIKTIQTVVLGTGRILELAQKTGAKVLHVSTSEVYGQPDVHPQPETYHGNVDTMSPRACYDESKRLSETICYEYRKKGVDVRVVRPFNVYGEHMLAQDGRIIPNFIAAAIQGNPLKVGGNGTQTRCFLYINDFVDGIFKLMAAKDFWGPVNIGNPEEEYEVLEVANLIIAMTYSKSKIEFYPMPEGDPVRRQPDISFAKEKLNWTPHWSLLAGLGKTIDWYEKNV